MRTSMRSDLTAAIKARDRVTVAALRSALAAMENAEALPAESVVPQTSADGVHIAGAAVGNGSAEAERRQLSESELRAIVETEVDERVSAATQYEQAGKQGRAQRLRGEADVLSRYLTAGG